MTAELRDQAAIAFVASGAAGIAVTFGEPLRQHYAGPDLVIDAIPVVALRIVSEDEADPGSTAPMICE